MKHLFILFSIIYTVSLMSQTSVIAFKSRSGKMAFFNAVAAPDNLGIVFEPNLLSIEPKQVDTVIRISDSVLVQFSKTTLRDSTIRHIDTIIYYPSKNENTPLIDIENHFPKTVFIGFDSAKTEVDTTHLIIDGNQLQEQNINQPIIGSPNSKHSNPFNTSFLALTLCSLVFLTVIFNLRAMHKKIKT